MSVRAWDRACRWRASTAALVVAAVLVVAPTAATVSAAEPDDDPATAGVAISVEIAPIETCLAKGGEKPPRVPPKGGACATPQPPRGPKGGHPVVS